MFSGNDNSRKKYLKYLCNKKLRPKENFKCIWKSNFFTTEYIIYVLGIIFVK